MDDRERDAGMLRQRERIHAHADAIQKRAMAEDHALLRERVARLEETAKDFAMMKVAIAGAVLEGLLALGIALLYRGGK